MTGDELRGVCLALPGTTEKETWGEATQPGEATFRVRDTIYVILAPDGSGASIRTSLDEQADLIDAFPAAFSSAPYVGRFGWVSVRMSAVDGDVLRGVVERAWARTAPKAIAAALREHGG